MTGIMRMETPPVCVYVPYVDVRQMMQDDSAENAPEPVKC